MDLSNKDLLADYFPNINEDTKTFYDYMNIFYDEISRLEEVLEFDSSKLPALTVEIYNGIYIDSGGKGAGYYDSNPPKISIDTVSAFSHEFVHYVDASFNRKFKYKAYPEMRAEYYSQNFQLWLDHIQDHVYQHDMEQIQKNKITLINPLAEAENYLGRKLTSKDYYLLYNDLLLYAYFESGAEMPSLFNVSDGWYPTSSWISLFNFISRTYGKEALDTIMFEEKLPDGTMKTITATVEEWKVYITNLTEDDYGNYYD